MKLIIKIFLCIFTVSFVLTTNAGTLADVKKKGFVQCGVNSGVPGFAAADDAGKMTGIDVDVCRAVAAAVLGNADKVKYTPLTAKERFTALSSGEIDLLSRNTTHTLTRDGSLGLDFTYYNYIDGQGFLVHKNIGVTSAKQLDGASICVQSGTTTELNLADFFRTNGMDYKPVNYDTTVQTRQGFERNACDALTSDTSQLAAIRSELKKPNSAVILPEIISKEPLGPVVRQNDSEWRNVVIWSLYAMINAEEYGVTSKNINKMKKSTNPNIKRLLGVEGDMGKKLNLPNDWAYRIIKQVGNYGEIFERNVGKNSPLKLPRGVNQLWSKGGILYAPPIR